MEPILATMATTMVTAIVVRIAKCHAISIGKYMVPTLHVVLSTLGGRLGQKLTTPLSTVAVAFFPFLRIISAKSTEYLAADLNLAPISTKSKQIFRRRLRYLPTENPFGSGH
jgi:hypothetical protein